MRYQHIFGPVPSRRLGISLGIDPIPFKTCTYNCVYCECGGTTNLTIERKEYIPIKDIINELKDYLDKNPKLDYITFSGSGEPTLNIGIGKIIEFLKSNYPYYKIAVLTNGSLLFEKSVRNEIIGADLVMPSLDVVSEQAFRRINRPPKSLEIQKIVSGLIEFRKEFEGQIWLEVFIVPGLNDTDNELKLLKDAIKKIKPNRVQINSLDRPGTENWVQPVSKENMERIVSLFQDLPVEIIANFKPREQIASFDFNIEERILATIKRRPCTAEDLSETLGIHINEVNKYLQTLLERRIIESQNLERGVFFKTIKDGK
ncbi:MAG: radical SAM protein [Candidatus Cloacimonadota bacterium]|nr:radical SAM protein [Candidatus Cloacimonadota bacterium]